MDSTPSERYTVIRKIAISVVIQSVYVIFTYRYVPIPESLSLKPTNTCCLPIATLHENGYSVRNHDTRADICLPVVGMSDALVKKKYCWPSTTEEQFSSNKNLYSGSSVQHQDGESTTKQHCVLCLEQTSIIDRFVYTLRWQMFSASTVLLAIIDVALRRLYSKALDPINGHAEYLVEVKVRILQNTLEQLICNLIGQLVLCTYLTEKSMKIIPILVSLFVIGRLIFKLGYEQCPSRRTYGFAVTYIPTFITYIYCAWCAMAHVVQPTS